MITYLRPAIIELPEAQPSAEAPQPPAPNGAFKGLKLTVYFGVCGSDWPDCPAGHAEGVRPQWKVEAEAVVRLLTAVPDQPTLVSRAAFDLGLYICVDYRCEWKKTTELKIGSTMVVLGSRYMVRCPPVFGFRGALTALWCR